jgi:dTDP-4-amino-4,6-dideoxygalactose transaminase
MGAKNVSDEIPLHKIQNTIGPEVLDSIREVLQSGWLTCGPKTEEFERTLADYIGCKYGVAANSCTSALYLAVDGLGIKKGSSFVVPVNTFVADPNVLRLLGFETVFCDVTEDGEIDVTKLETLLQKDNKIEGVIGVHLYGLPCNIGEIIRLSKKYNIKIIEDCAQSIGAEFGDRRVGSFGDASCFSFYATKNLTTGEGGMLITNSEEIKNNARLVRNHGQNKTPKEKFGDWRYDVRDLGFNFRMSEIEAAIGLKQMEKLEIITQSRREIAKKYAEELKKIEGLEMLHDPASETLSKSAYHLLVVKVEKQYPIGRDELYYYLKEKGITTGVHYPPLHYFSYYGKTTQYKKGDFPVAEALYTKILSLPIFPFMEDQEFQRIIKALKTIGRRK